MKHCRRLVDGILGEGTYDNWRANRLEATAVEPRTDSSLDPAFTAKIRRLQKSGVDELLLANVVAGRISRQLGVASNEKQEQQKAGKITAQPCREVFWNSLTRHGPMNLEAS